MIKACEIVPSCYAFSRMKTLVRILPSKNIPESLEFYQREYGFQSAWAWTKSGQRVADFSSANKDSLFVKSEMCIGNKSIVYLDCTTRLGYFLGNLL